MTALEHATQNEPIVGWRAWRVLKVETLREGDQFRLCAVGTRGVPKSWDPRTPVRAVCSSFKSTHEAPHPEHECGIYAMRSRAHVERLLDDWKDNQGKPDAWALGRVSLWGRVVEFELGWRGEYGYPYEVTVYTDEPVVAEEIRDLYAVDVEVVPALVSSEPEDEEEDDDAGTLRSDLEKLQRVIEGLSAALLQSSTHRGDSPTDSWRAEFNAKWELRKALEKACDDPEQLVSAVVDAIAEHSGSRVPMPVASSRDAAKVLVTRSGAEEKLLGAEHVGTVANALRRLWYGGGVTLLQYDDSSGRHHWYPGAISDDELAALNDDETPREKYRTLRRVSDKRGEEDASTVRTLHRLTRGTTGSFVRAAVLLKAFRAKERPRNLAVLGHSLVRNEWRGLVEWTYLPSRSSGTKLWALTSAGVAAVGGETNA